MRLSNSGLESIVSMIISGAIYTKFGINFWYVLARPKIILTSLDEAITGHFVY
jgi:hypothetical protein